jgi:excisionase family DNA binding protein
VPADSKAPAVLSLADRLALRPREAARALGLSERAFRALLPRLPHVRAGTAILIPVEALRRWLEEEGMASGERVDAAVDEVLKSFE